MYFPSLVYTTRVNYDYAMIFPISITFMAFWNNFIVASLIFSQFFFIHDNSIVGGSLIITGLYAVTWASYRERQAAAGVIPLGSWVSESPIRDKSSYHRVHIFSGTPGLSPKPSD